MIVPEFWAEATQRIEWVDGEGKHSRVMRRFGWSDESADDAQSHARDRVADAVRLHQQGKRIRFREAKVAYNSEEGLPIREEIVARHGQTVITRNSYGARCLNTPSVLFADIDCDEPSGCGIYLASIVFSFIPLFFVFSAIGWGRQIPLSIVLALIIGGLLGSAINGLKMRVSGSAKQRWKNHFRASLGNWPQWAIRLYETPAGWRLLATHQTFEPRDEVVEQFFKSMQVDQLYARMCLNQNCFRARVSPKPWRIGIDHHLKPRPGVWPIPPDRMPQQTEWVENYERLASKFSSCRFIESFGPETVCQEAAEVIRIHDETCQSMSEKPLA